VSILGGSGTSVSSCAWKTLSADEIFDNGGLGLSLSHPDPQLGLE
jgi:hypothetical protein